VSATESVPVFGADAASDRPPVGAWDDPAVRHAVRETVAQETPPSAWCDTDGDDHTDGAR
jgi:hypothetical protein